MDRIRRLANPVKNYDWGSRRFLAELRGEASPSDQPEAELWMGAHPEAPSQLEGDDGAPIGLDAWIERDVQASLGSRCRSTLGDELPFLLKVLAPERALSVQTHPDAERAARGFATEEAAGLDRRDPKRSYRDPRPKPELLCALTPFRALCGLRPRQEAVAWLDALELPLLRERTEPLRGAEPDAYARFLEATLSAPAQERTALAENVAHAARARRARLGESTSEEASALAIVDELATQYPGDLGLLAPLFLRSLELAPGEALFLEAGTLHAYLGGAGVELMANSDNVLRCALTHKWVDVPELVDALEPGEDGVAPLRPETIESDGGRLVRWAAPTPWFQLARLRLDAFEASPQPEDHGPQIWVCTDGEARFVDGGGSRIPVARGESVWVPAAAGALRVEGGRAGAELFRAGIPL